jgi:hypothetical protein
VLHLTLRAAWHDRAWDGTVCNHPSKNAFCLARPDSRGRDDAYEESVAGSSWAEFGGDSIPPCRVEAGAFMNAREWTRIIHHPYQEIRKAQDTHGHLRPTPVKVPRIRPFAYPSGG